MTDNEEQQSEPETLGPVEGRKDEVSKDSLGDPVPVEKRWTTDFKFWTFYEMRALLPTSATKSVFSLRSLNSELDKMIHAGRHKRERVGVASIFTVGSLVPFGGGSGGGSFNAGNTMPEPVPIGVLGLNSVVTYGENFQATAGLNHQVTLGNNLQICVNPLGLSAGVPGIPAAPALTSALGAGLGGNMQFTIGTSANFVLGQEFDINLGPPKIEISGPYSDHPGTVILCGVLGAAVMAWTVLYDALTEDAQRAQLAIAFQALVDALLIATLGVEMSMKMADQELMQSDSLMPMWASNHDEDNEDWGILSFGAGAASLGSVLAPLTALGAK